MHNVGQLVTASLIAQSWNRHALSTSAFLFRDSFRDCHWCLCELFIYARANLAKISNGARSTKHNKIGQVN